MINHIDPIYRRVILKISGEALQRSKGLEVDSVMLDRMALEVQELVQLGVQIAIVVGGGNLYRGTGLIKFGMNRIIGDHIGMLATMINCLFVYNALNRICVHSKLMSAIALDGICEHYNWIQAIDELSYNKVVIFGAGIGNPCFTTDSAACLRGIEIRADAVLKATKVDGVFSNDPVHYPNDSVLYEQLSYKEVLERELKVMDFTAFILARDYNLPIHIFNINRKGALKKIIMGYKEGTLISNK